MNPMFVNAQAVTKKRRDRLGCTLRGAANWIWEATRRMKVRTATNQAGVSWDARVCSCAASAEEGKRPERRSTDSGSG